MHKLLGALVLSGATLVSCEEKRAQQSSDKDSGLDSGSMGVADSAIATGPDATKDTVSDASDALVNPDAAPCLCPDETCSEGEIAKEGFCCCWGTPGSPQCGF